MRCAPFVIELGVAYLSVLSSDEFPAVTNSTSRDYVAIAAYNTGPGSVIKVFGSGRTTAVTAMTTAIESVDSVALDSANPRA